MKSLYVRSSWSDPYWNRVLEEKTVGGRDEDEVDEGMRGVPRTKNKIKPSPGEGISYERYQDLVSGPRLNEELELVLHRGPCVEPP